MTLSGEFSDPGVLDNHTIVIDWDDGFSNTLNFSAGERSFSISHPYPDDVPSGTPSSDLYPISVTVTDNDGDAGSNIVNLTVNNLAPVLEEISAPIGTLQINTDVNVSVDFTDPGIQDTNSATWD